MVSAYPRDVGRVHELEVRQAVPCRGHAVGSPSGLDGIQCGTHRAIADGVDMYVEAREVHALDVFEDDLTGVLELATREGALRRMVAIDLHECGDGGLVAVFLWMSAYFGACCRGCVHVARYFCMASGVHREDRLQKRFQSGGIGQCGRDCEGVALEDAVGEELDEIGM